MHLSLHESIRSINQYYFVLNIQYFEEIILLDVLHTIQKKQIFHIKDLEKKNKLNGEKLLRDYVKND